MAQPSHRLNLLRKFEKQIAPLERHHVDFLDLCEDTRGEIRDLESKGLRAQGLDAEKRRTAPSHNPEEAGRKEQGADVEYPARTNSTTNENEGRFRHARAKRALRRAKSLKEPPERSKWFGIFNRRKSASMKVLSPAPAPAPQLGPMRTLEPRPSVEAEGIMVGRPRRLSKVDRMNGRKGREEGGGRFEDEVKGVSWGSVPNAHDIEEQERENERLKYPSALGNNEEEVWESGGKSRVEEGREKGKGGNESGRETDGEGSDRSMITYDDVNKIGRAARISILDRWRRERDARQ
ncbi:MAG: hypothetical protein Q9215_002741 [Flavoplaca cf. flavocitrina]